MRSSIQMAKVELVDELEFMATAQANTSLRTFAGLFVRALYENTAPGDFVDERPETLLTAGLSLMEFCRHRRAGESKVRVLPFPEGSAEADNQEALVEIVTDDMPFLVDSVHTAFERLPGAIRLLLHPILQAQRSTSGQLVEYKVPQGEEGEQLESVMQLRVTDLPDDKFEQVKLVLEGVLGDVRAATEDFAAMRDRCLAQADALQLRETAEGSVAREAAAFVQWMADEHFAFLGYSYCRFESAPLSSAPLDLSDMSKVPPRAPGIRFDRDAGLGLLRDPNRSMFDVFEPPRKREPLRILKANRHSTVHRGVYLDTVLVSDFDVSGQLVGGHMFVGLFSASAYNSPTATIPVVREKIERALARANFSPATHNGRRLRYLLESYPRDELLQISDADLFSISIGILNLQYSNRVALFVRRDPFGRFISCLVYIPRERLDTSLRTRVESILCEEFEGSLSAYYPQVTDAPLARLHLIINTPGLSRRHIDFAALERKLEQAAQTWQEKLRHALCGELGRKQGITLADHYASAFPIAYREACDEFEAFQDIEFVQTACTHRQIKLRMYRHEGTQRHAFHLKVFSPNGYLELSRLIPILENLGLLVIGAVPYALNVPQNPDFWIHDFSLQMRNDRPVDLDKVHAAFEEVFLLTWDNHADDDGFNQLVLHADLTARHVALLRAFSKYLRQICVPFSEGYMQQTLRNNPQTTQLLVELFAARFDPETHSESGAKAIRVKLTKAFDGIKSLDEDRILKLFSTLIDATTRTNFYQALPPLPGAERPRHQDHLSFKFNSHLIVDLPPPIPFAEIFVSGPRVEGIHLRFGEVSRGGLRWSDRQEDFRTEVLGLVKAQQVKNAVIVPMGSKGGFVLKRPPSPEAGRDALREEGIAAYELFIGCLLDLTDNWDPTTGHTEQPSNTTPAIVPPPQTVRHDSADPYLVVAADKGTATFSDLANRVAVDRHFWLDDAFASGGSAGYDHKQMGITAKGAWESVKRHFREMQHNTQTQPFTVAGVGDMSGDVFGNGMLLSRQILLVAAFDHRDIFLDPTPDPAISFAERQRLFNLPRSSWQDYERDRISAGGGVFSRSDKSIPLTNEIRELLGVDAEAMPPGKLIQAILRARVALLFFGGIGTYCKARSQSHSEVGDRANDALRINANELRAAVVAEGANLGLTQQARVQYALSGGRCNTDFIDNSAGVDCSDHEVNIKILLREAELRGELQRAERDALLASMTEELSHLVLLDNYQHTQALSVHERLGEAMTDRLTSTLRHLEKAGDLDRALEALPDDEALVERQRSGKGFSRPELCVLLAYAKNALADRLLREPLPESEQLDEDLVEYFPTALRETYRQDIVAHQLRNELRVMLLSNDLVNRAGIPFVHEVQLQSEQSVTAVAMAYLAARQILDARVYWQQVEALDNEVSTDVQADLLAEAMRSLQQVTLWLLRQYSEQVIESHIAEYRAGVASLRRRISDVLPPHFLQLRAERAGQFEAQGVPAKLARAAASLPFLMPALDTVRLADECHTEVIETGQLYTALGTRFGLDWLRDHVASLPTSGTWDRQAAAGLDRDVLAAHRQLARVVLTRSPTGLSKDRLFNWIEENQASVGPWDTLMAELQCSSEASLSMIAVAMRHLQALVRNATR